MFRRIKYSIFLILVALLSNFCANVVQPVGGIKDEIAPEIVGCIPENGVINYTGEKIFVHFSEFVTLKNLNDALLVSPPMEEKPEVRLRGKGMIIDLKDNAGKLRDSTTYMMSFGNAIVDITEGNPVEDYRFVFSTGPEIDSLMIKGKVVNAFDHKPMTEGLVMIYRNYRDSTPILDKPDYLTRISEDGSFFISNLSSGSYRIFGLKDANKNMLFDQASEQIAFLDSLIVPIVEVREHTDTIQDTVSITETDTVIVDSLVVRRKYNYHPLDIELFMFLEESVKRQFLVKSERPKPGCLVFVFNNAVNNDFSVKLLDYEGGDDWFVSEKNAENDSIVYWITDTLMRMKDTLRLERKYPRTDSAGGIEIITDTVNIKYQRPKPDRKGKVVQDQNDTLIVGFDIGTQIDFYKNVTLSFSHPLKNYDINKISLFQIVDTIKNKKSFEFSKDSLLLGKYHIAYKWLEDEKYKVLIEPGAFTDLYGYTNDTIMKSFSVKSLDQYSKIILSLPDVGENMIIQLLNSKDVVIKEQVAVPGSKVMFEYLDPGKYKLKAISDENGNKKWDTGKYLENRQSETIFNYGEEFEAKQGWDVEMEWKFVKEIESEKEGVKEGE